MSIQLTVMSLDFDSSGAPMTTVYNKSSITLGRSSDNDVVLDRPEVSEVHARLRVELDGEAPILYITDLGSSNGTLVENNSLKSEVEVKMLPNERIIIGNYLIKPTVIKESVEDALANGSSGRESGGQTVERMSVGDSLNGSATHEALPLNGSHASVIELAPPDEPAAEELTAAAAVEAAFLSEVAAEEPPTAEMAIADAAPAQPQSEWESTPYWRDPVPESSAPAAPRVADEGVGSVTIMLDGTELDEINFEAVELFAIRGVVTHKGAPLAGVEVRAGAVGTVTTGDDGSYRFADVPEGTAYDLSAAKQGYIFDCGASIGTVTGEVVLPIAATQLFPIEVSVQHKQQPLAGVVIDAGTLGSFTTNDEGVATIPDVPEFTQYQLRVSKPKFLCEPAELSGEVGSGVVSLQVNARELFTISGRVVHRGKALEGATVDGGKIGTTTTDADGNYSFENVPEGERYTLRVSKPKYRIRRS